MTKKTDTPAIRFKGFSDTWEQRKAIDIADYSKGNGYSKGDLTDAGTPIILYGRLYTKYQFAISEVDTFTVPRNGAVYSQGNEVIVPASGETADDIARASAVEKSGVLLGGDLNILRPFDFINPLFLALAISNGEPQKELAKKAQGKSVVHIHNTDIQEVTIAYPSRTEQDRIVSVFRQLDNLITLHQREYEKLHNIKKSMLEKMFPKNGSNVPEIRFKGFTEAWEQRKLNEVGVVIDPHPSHRAPKEEQGGIPFIGIGDVDEMGNINRESARPVPENVYDEHHKRYDLNVPSLGLGRVASLGKVIRLRSDIGKYAISPTISVLQFSENINIDYLYAYMNTPQFKKQFEGKSNGSTRQSVGTEMVRLLNLSMPFNLDEQKAIGTFYKNLDNLITLHQRELEKLQNIKKSMLEKMFVSEEKRK